MMTTPASMHYRDFVTLDFISIPIIGDGDCNLVICNDLEIQNVTRNLQLIDHNIIDNNGNIIYNSMRYRAVESVCNGAVGIKNFNQLSSRF